MKILKLLFCVGVLLSSSLFSIDSFVLRGTMELKDNTLFVGGCNLNDLSKLSPYPIYVLDEDLIRTNMNDYVRALKQNYPKPGMVYYACKALMCTAMCKIAQEEQMGLDVCSGGELFTAMTAGFPAERMIFHGNGKSDEELTMAIEYGVARIAVDNLDEARAISAIAQKLDTEVKVILRVKAGVHADTHHYIVTGTEDSKFGFNILDGSALDAIQQVLNMPGIAFEGIHSHIGSQVLNLEGYMKTVEILAIFCQELEELNIDLHELDLGGGLGVRYTAADQQVLITEYIQQLTTKLIEEFQNRKMELPTLILEPGRSIIAEAGTSLYRVDSVKAMPGEMTYVAVNGGMTDNIRPALYSAKYYSVITNRLGELEDTHTKVVGKCCESGDILVQDCWLPKAQRGDTVAVFTTGAYGFTMASNYNRLPVPGVLLVKDGSYDWVVRPQDYSDLIRNDQLPGWLQ